MSDLRHRCRGLERWARGVGVLVDVPSERGRVDRGGDRRRGRRERASLTSGEIGIVLSDDEPASAIAEQSRPAAARRGRELRKSPNSHRRRHAESTRCRPTVQRRRPTECRHASQQAPAAAGGERGELRPARRRPGERPRVRRRRQGHEIRLRLRSLDQHGRPAAGRRQAAAASKACDRSTSVHQFHIIFFNQQTATLRPDAAAGGGSPLPPTATRNWPPTSSAASRPTAAPIARRRCAAAIAMQPDVIFFLTDADDPMPAERAGRDRRAQSPRRRRRSATIEFGRGPAEAGEELPHRAGADHRRAVRLRRHDEAVAVAQTAELPAVRRLNSACSTRSCGRRCITTGPRTWYTPNCVVSLGQIGVVRYGPPNCAVAWVVAAELVVEPLEPRAADAPAPVGLHRGGRRHDERHRLRRRRCARTACSSRSSASGAPARCTGAAANDSATPAAITAAASSESTNRRFIFVSEVNAIRRRG